MTEKQKQRAKIKKEFQKVAKAVRMSLKKNDPSLTGIIDHPKALLPTKSLEAPVMTAVLHCGRGRETSSAISSMARNHKALNAFLQKHRGGAVFEVVHDGHRERVQIKITFHEAV